MAGAISLLGALEAAAIAQEIRLPLYAKGNEGERPWLFLTVTATVNDGTASATRTPTRIIVDTGSSQLSLPVKAQRLVSFTNSSLYGGRVPKATITLGEGANAITIRNAPINIITQRCVAASMNRIPRRAAMCCAGRTALTRAV